MRTLSACLAGLCLCACTGFSPAPMPGSTTYAQVVRDRGTPTKTWVEADGSRRLAYAHGPMGVQTEMVEIDANGIVAKVFPALTTENFARVQPGMTQDQVERLLGPLTVSPTYFARRDELVWEWPYCDDWRVRERFYVLFDGTQKTVRSTMSLQELCGRGTCPC